jgi:hypothetical protein
MPSRSSPDVACVLSLLACAACAPAAAEEPRAPSKLEQAILSRSPEVRVDKVDQERLAVRRLDIVDDKGVIRMSLGSPTPAPIVDGIQYKRAFPVSGLVIFDKDGSERGGFGVADIEGTAVVIAQDHVNGDAIGWRIMPDGSVTFQINERAAVKREASIGGRIAPTNAAASRIRLNVAPTGTPSIALADKQDRPRLRLTVTDEGFGSIEFLDSEGRIVDSITPERARRAGP